MPIGYNKAKDILTRYNDIVLEIASIETIAHETLMMMDCEPEYISKYGGRIPQGESPSKPERFAMRNERLLEKHRTLLAQISDLKRIVNTIDYCFHAVLTPQQKEVLELRFISALEYQEVAKMMHRSVGYCKQLAREGIERVAGVLYRP